MENMNEIIIDDGCEEYTFKNKFGDVFARFSFNACDTGIIERYKKVVNFFETFKLPDNITIDNLDAFTDAENQIKEQFNVLCGNNVSDGLFMRYNPLTLFANGDFYATVALEQISKFIEQKTGEKIESKKAKIRKDIARNRS